MTRGENEWGRATLGDVREGAELEEGVVRDVRRAERRAGLEMVVGREASRLADVILFSLKLA